MQYFYKGTTGRRTNSWIIPPVVKTIYTYRIAYTNSDLKKKSIPNLINAISYNSIEIVGIAFIDW